MVAYLNEKWNIEVIMIEQLNKLCSLYGASILHLEVLDQYIINKTDYKGSVLRFRLRKKRGVWHTCTDGYNWSAVRTESLPSLLKDYLEMYR